MGNFTIGLSVFERNLRNAMDSRINDFVSYVRNNFSDPVEGVSTYSRATWAYMFKKWSEKNNFEHECNVEILKYLDDHR